MPAFSGASPASISSATATAPTRSPGSPPRTTETASRTPYAQLRKDLGFEFCNTVSEKNPLVAGPLRRTDCSLVSDGAAAIVLTDTETALRRPKAVHIRALAQANDFLPMSKRDIVAFEGCTEAWRRAHAEAGTSLDDLDLVETHDSFYTGAISLYYKCTQSHHGPAAIICQKVHDIDISGAIAGGIPAIDSLDQDPITTIKTGDWVEIDAPKVGQKATVTITRGAQATADAK